MSKGGYHLPGTGAACTEAPGPGKSTAACLGDGECGDDDS